MFTWSNKAEESKAKSDKKNKKEYKKIDEFSDDITCNICLEQYSTDQNNLKSPRILQCGHTFCLECLTKIYEKHNKTVIKCYFDSEDTRLESLSDLTVNVVIIGTIINYDFNKQQMIYKYQNKIDQLQEEIGKEIHENLKQLEETWDKLHMHFISIYSVKNKVKDVIDELIKIKNQDTQSLFNLEEYKKLENYLNELTTNEKFYKKLFELVYRRLAKLNVIENEFKETDKIEKLVDYHIYILHLKEYVKEILEDDRIKKSFEGLSTLNDIEEKIMKRLKEIEQEFNVEQLLRYIKNKSEGNHKANRIGILGLMNVGKSSLINRFRGIKDTDVKNGAARVNIDECTDDINYYTWGENKEFEFWDHPGYTSSDIIEKYFQKFLSKKPCDIYIILYTRLEENDVKIAKYIFTVLGVEFLMCRTYSDNHIDQIITDLNEKDKIISDEEAFNEYKKDSLSVLDKEKYSEYFDAKFTRELCKDRTFFISCHRRYHTKYDWKNFNEKILKIAKPDLAEKFAEFSPFTSGKKVIRKKREALEKNILGFSIASAATDIIPVAGAFADLAIICYEAKKYQNAFGLTQENFEKMADLFGVTLEERKSISRIIGLDSIYVNIKNLVLLLLGSIPGGIQAISFFLSLGTAASISFPLFAPIAVIMALASAPISYIMTKDVLTKILCQMEYDSFRMIDFLEKKIKVGESNFSYVISHRETRPEQPDSIVCQHEICQISEKPSKKNCAKCQKAFCSDHCKKIMTIPFKQLPKKHKVCDICYQDSNFAERIEEDENINKLVFKRDSEKCSVDGCNKPFNWKTKKYHCEKCGSCICYDHSRNELKFSIIVLEPEDVCDQCYENEVNN